MGFHSMKCPLFLVLLSMVACVSAPSSDIETNDIVSSVSKVEQGEDTNDDAYQQTIDAFYEQNETLLDLATLIAEKNQFSSYFDLQGAAFQLEAHKQGLYPQVTPVTSIQDDGDAIARLLVEQTLWDNGRYKAGKKVLLAEEDRATAVYRTQANERIAQGLGVALEYQKYTKLIDLTEELLIIFEDLNEMAYERGQGGIGRRAEQDLFSLKVLQIEGEKSDYTAMLLQAEHEFFNLLGVRPASILDDNTPLTVNVPELTAADWAHIPAMAEGLADIAETKAELESGKAEGRPRLVFNGSTGSGNDQGSGVDDQVNNARIGFAFSQPLNWGANRVLDALKQNVLASETRMAETRREVENELSMLQQRRDFLASSLPERQRISALAEERIANFQQDFTAGASTILEAVNILETAKSLSVQYAEALYEIETIKLEQARTRGLLGPVEHLSAKYDEE